MALDVRTKTIIFDAPGKLSGEVNFTNTINTYGAALQGFTLEYADEDHLVKEMRVFIVNVEKEGDTKINFDVELSLIDDSDNLGKGSVDVAIIADVQAY